MSDNSQVERQLIILQIMSSNKRSFTVDEIRMALRKNGIDVSVKTVERDMLTISTNFYVKTDEREGKETYTADKYFVENISMSYQELFSLYFAREILKPYLGTELGDNAFRILDSIVLKTPGIAKPYINSLKNTLKVEVFGIHPEKDLDQELMSKIKDAIADEKTIEIEYNSFSSDEIAERKVDPYFMEISEGRWKVVGYCHLRKSIRSFRLSRILKIETLNNTFTRPEEFYEEYKKGKFDKLNGDDVQEIVIRFSGDAAKFVREYEHEKADRLIEEKNGKLLFFRKAHYSKEIEKWVMSFGSNAEVIGPQSLVVSIKKQIIKMTQYYDLKENQ